jgi:hypothetical protein
MIAIMAGWADALAGIPPASDLITQGPHSPAPPTPGQEDVPLNRLESLAHNAASQAAGPQDFPAGLWCSPALRYLAQYLACSSAASNLRR